MAPLLKEQIANSKAKLLLTSPKYFDALLDKVIAYDIPFCVDGIKEIATAINEYFLSHYDCKKIIAVQMSGFGAHQKHLGSIIERIKSELLVVYIISHEHYWLSKLQQNLKDEIVLCADCEFLEHLHFFSLIIDQGGILRLHTGVRNLKLTTSMEQISNRICTSQALLDLSNINFFLSSYVNIHSQHLYDEIFALQSFGGILNPSLRLIKGGYPSIEREVLEFGEELDYNIVRDSVIFISTHVNFEEPKKLARLIALVLEHTPYRVIFKSCPPLEKTHKAKEDEFAKPFLGEKNFIYWTNDRPRLSKQELARSITAIELYSSMMYSYPCITKRPSLLLYPPKEQIATIKDCFYHPNLHIRIFGEDKEAFLQSIHTLANSTQAQKQWEEAIRQYCQKDLYNYGLASEYLASWILHWFKKRERLQ